MILKFISSLFNRPSNSLIDLWLSQDDTQVYLFAIKPRWEFMPAETATLVKKSTRRLCGASCKRAVAPYSARLAADLGNTAGVDAFFALELDLAAQRAVSERTSRVATVRGKAKPNNPTLFEPTKAWSLLT